MNWIPMAAPSVGQEEVLEQVAEVLRSGRLREGVYCRQFEEEFAARVGVRYAVAVNSGTSALHTVYLALLQPGDEVLVPSFSFIATASMLLAMGARPVFCDIDPRTFTLDVDDAERRITPKTRAMVPVHLFGNGCDVEGLLQLAARYDLKVVWDGAQSHGTRYHGRDIGGFPEAVCYSFYPSKSMTTGEGGMIASSEAGLVEKCRLLRNHGQAGPYEHVMLGFNYRMTEVSAVLGLSQLHRLEEFLGCRRNNAALLMAGLQAVPGVVTPYHEPEVEHSFSQYSILLEPHLARHRNRFRELLKEAGVDSAVYYPRPLHRQPLFAVVGKCSLPVTEEVAGRIVSLPVHPGLASEDIDRIVAAVRTAVDRLEQVQHQREETGEALQDPS